MFGRATITLGIGPHSSSKLNIGPNHERVATLPSEMFGAFSDSQMTVDDTAGFLRLPLHLRRIELRAHVHSQRYMSMSYPRLLVLSPVIRLIVGLYSACLR